MKEEYYWSICLEESSVQAAIWTIKNGAADIVHISTSVSWENEETLVTAADECLSSCIQNLPQDIEEPSKTVFGVPSSWVIDGQIDRKYLDKIRLVCNKLSLNPSGFVVLPEAIAHFEKLEEKTPISAVLIGVYPQNLDVSVFRLGNISGSVNVARSTSVEDDVLEGLARFESLEPIPSRFLLYDSKMQDLEEVKQNLIKAEWNHEKVKFLHTPQVEIVKSESKMQAVCLGGAVEIGQVNGIVKKEVIEKKENLEEGVVDAASLGFNIGSEVAPGRKNLDLGKFTPSFKMPELNFNLHNENTILAAVVVGFFVLVTAFVVYWFVPKATVTIYVNPQKLESKENLKISPTNNITIDGQNVPSQVSSVTVTGTKSMTTTGTKTVGTPSKGPVTFYNVADSVSIPQGTILTASGLNFTLDSDVQVASASGAAGAATANGNITSSGVGADYNVASGTFFSVGGFSSSSLQAKSTSDLGGGSSQDVVAVSKDDTTSLTNDLTNDLKTQGQTNLKSNLQASGILITPSIQFQTKDKTFDHNVGDQSATLKLSMTLSATGDVIAKKDLVNLVNSIFANKVPKGYVLTTSGIDYVFDQNSIDFKISLLPNVNISKLRADLAGKSKGSLDVILSKDVPGYASVQIDGKPNIPFLNSLPHVPNNISIQVLSK